MKKPLRITLIIITVIITILGLIIILGPTTIQVWNGALRLCSKDGVSGNLGNPVPYPCCSGTHRSFPNQTMFITDGGYTCGK